MPTEYEAIKLVKGLASLCEMGGFHITKWMSNSRPVLESIPTHERAKDVANLDFEHFPTDRALGVSWDIESDNIVFNINPQSCDATRRNCRFSTETFWRLVFSHEWFVIHLQRDEVELEMNSEPRV